MRDVTDFIKVREPVNYFVYPYVEVSGKQFPNVANDFSFADVQAAQTSGGQ